METEPDSDVRGDRRSRQLRCFWLCDACCRTMTIVSKKEEGIKVVLLPASAGAAVRLALARRI